MKLALSLSPFEGLCGVGRSCKVPWRVGPVASASAAASAGATVAAGAVGAASQQVMWYHEGRRDGMDLAH